MAGPRLQVSNNAQTTLAASITAAAVTLTVANASNFPAAGPFRITIDAEIMEIATIDKSTNTFSGITRGLEGTVAAVHNAGASVENRFTAGSFAELGDDAALRALIAQARTYG